MTLKLRARPSSFSSPPSRPKMRRGMVAETERKLIREWQQAGIEAAKAKGVYKSRRPYVPVEKVWEMHDAGHGPTAIAKALGISRMSAHCALSPDKGDCPHPGPLAIAPSRK